jgi:hypothetical protein
MGLLEELARDSVQSTPASNQAMFDDSLDYAALVAKRKSVVDQWRNLSRPERAKYKSQADFEAAMGGVDLKDPKYSAARNLYLVRQEVAQRLNTSEVLRLLPVDDLDFSDSLIELAECLENVDDIREIYRIRKQATGSSTNAGINADEARRVKNCFTQGRELYLAGRHGSLMVRPLNFFYALTAYAYGAVILNNPLRYRKDMIPGSHGMAYLPDTVEAQFGGDSARGTFSDLVTAFPTQLIKTVDLEFHIDCTESLQALYKTRFTVSLGTLLSMVPEMSSYYEMATGQPGRCFPLQIVTASDARALTWEFHIGNGERRPKAESISDSFPDLVHSERHGKTVVTVPASKASKIRASIYKDIRGDLWFVENPFFPVLLPEIAVHFLIASVFSNVMRYRPDEWASILTNEVKSSVSLLTRHYFSSFQRKFLVTVLGAVSKYIPYASRA